MSGTGRRCHGVRGNASCETPSSLLSFDCESRPLDGGDDNARLHVLRMGTARYVRVEGGKPTRRDALAFDNGASFWGFVRRCLSKSCPLLVCAHNLLYDFRLVGGFDWLAQRSPAQWRLIMGPRPVIMSGKWDGYQLHLLDTLNWWKCELADMGAACGLAKLPMPAPDAPDDEWLAYCARDAEIVEASMLRLWQWWRNTDSGVMGKTIAACAWNSWRHGWRRYPGGADDWTPPEDRAQYPNVCDPPLMVHDDRDTIDLERRCHYGGRGECYRVGRIPGRWYLVDANSMYAYAMSSAPHPWRLRRRYESRSVLQLAQLLTTYVCAADVMIETMQDIYPVRRDERITYPVGTFHTSLCGAELEDAVTRGAVRAVGRVACYDVRDLFSAWVRYYYQTKARARQDGDTATARMSSALLQSLYGKFAQWGIGWKHAPQVHAPVEWGPFPVVSQVRECVERCMAVSGHSFLLETDPESFHSLPVVSASICAAARMYMRMIRNIAGHEHVAYEHTDAVIVDEVGMMRLSQRQLIDRGELGKLKVVLYGDDLHIYGIGDYYLGGVRACAGVRKDAIEVSDGVFEQRRAETVWESWGRRGEASIVWLTERLRLERAYRRRRILADGRTLPPELFELFDPGFWSRAPADGGGQRRDNLLRGPLDLLSQGLDSAASAEEEV